MEDVQISVTCRCRECQGEGCTGSPYWHEFYAWLPTYEEAHPRPDMEIEPAEAYQDAFCRWLATRRQAEDEWWRQAGFPPSDLPPEEDPCATCEGSGEETVRLSLQAFADLLQGVDVIRTGETRQPLIGG